MYHACQVSQVMLGDVLHLRRALRLAAGCGALAFRLSGLCDLRRGPWAWAWLVLWVWGVVCAAGARARGACACACCVGPAPAGVCWEYPGRSHSHAIDIFLFFLRPPAAGAGHRGRLDHFF